MRKWTPREVQQPNAGSSPVPSFARALAFDHFSRVCQSAIDLLDGLIKCGRRQNVACLGREGSETVTFKMVGIRGEKLAVSWSTWRR